MNTQTHHSTSDARGRIDPGAAALWASAFLILALVILQAGRLGAGAQARADVTEIGDTVLLTSALDASEDILAILDSRADTLMFYAVVNRNSIELRENVNLTELFMSARGVPGPGGRPRR
ncbi:MAG: hypothetical protein IBJ10_08315 [Phycisphaerales bacterium]|nr:hypothetical protein [Phycisphaerales bacterium]